MALEALKFSLDSGALCLHCDYMRALNNLDPSVQSSTEGRLRPSLSAPRPSPAFTLVELLATIAIISIVAGLVLGTLGYVNRKAAEGRAKAEVAALAAAIDNYKLEFGVYPEADPTRLYQELTGQGQVNTNRVFFEPKKSIAPDLTSGPFTDPWGRAYNYRTNDLRNIGLFDLWAEPPNAQDEKDWIHN